jgi:hypothetical protein
MKKMALFSLILLGVLVSSRMVRAGISTSLDTPAGVDAVDGGKLGPRIEIAASSVVDEKDPAVAVCGDIYLVVYEREGDIYGQRLNLSGDPLDTMGGKKDESQR